MKFILLWKNYESIVRMAKENTESLHKKSLIVKSNELINANYRLSPTEMKIIYLMATQVKMGDEDFKGYALRIQDFQDDLKLSKNGNSLHERMEEVVERLMRRIIKIRSDDGDLLQFPFLVRADHKNRNGVIELKFSPDLKPHMLDLKAKFTSFYDSNVLYIRSAHSMRIYEFLKQYEAIGKRTMKVTEIRTKLEIKPNQYRSYNMFKKKIILHAQEDLKGKYSDIYFNFNEKKVGRKIDSIEFIIIKKREADPFRPRIENGESIDQVSELKRELLNMGLTNAQIKKYVDDEQKDSSILKELIKETKERYKSGKVKNAAAYLVKLIEIGANPKSVFEMEAEKGEQLKREEKVRVQNEIEKKKKFINKVRKEYDEFRIKEKLKIYKNFSNEDLMEFEQYVRTLPSMYGKDLIKEGKLNADSKNYDHWIDVFIGSQKFPDYEEGLVNWVYNVYGVILRKPRSGENDFEIVSTQSSLFEKTDI